MTAGTRHIQPSYPQMPAFLRHSKGCKTKEDKAVAANLSPKKMSQLVKQNLHIDSHIQRSNQQNNIPQKLGSALSGLVAECHNITEYAANQHI